MNIKNEKALYEASLSGDVESVRHLLENEKVNINWRNPGEVSSSRQTLVFC